MLKMKISRIIFISVLAALLSGCPVKFKAGLTNEKISVIPPFEPTYNVKMGVNETEKLRWYQEFITGIDNSKELYFQGLPIDRIRRSYKWKYTS